MNPDPEPIQASPLPLISIAMATYNGAKYIEKQLESIYAQTYPNLEVVVCDDGSKDDTIAILKRYAETKGLRYYQNPTNLGFIKNFEKAMSLCEGEFIACSDQDDIWLPHKIERLHEQIGNNLLIHCDFAEMSHDEQLLAENTRKKWFGEKYPYLFLDPVKHQEYMTVIGLIQGCSCLVHRDLLKMAFPIPNNEGGHDVWLGFVAASQKRLKYLEEPLMYWRSHVESTSSPARQKPIVRISKQLLINLKTQLIYRRIRFAKRSNIMKQRGVAVGQYPLGFFEDVF